MLGFRVLPHHDEEPDVAISLPLGAGRLTRDLLGGDPPTAQAVQATRAHVRAELARQLLLLYDGVKTRGIIDFSGAAADDARSAATALLALDRS